MDPITVQVESSLQALLVEQALAMAKELEVESDKAADGKVLDTVETIALKSGRELMRLAVQGALQAQAEAVEKKVRPHGFVSIAIAPDATKEVRRDRF